VDRNQFVKALWLAKLDRRITATCYLIGRAMLRRANRKGTLWPSLETLAADVGCCARTAGRAVASLRQAALLSWHSRRARWNRCAPNFYQLERPKPVEEKKKILLESSVNKMSDGSHSAELAGALARLGMAMGVPAEAVMPWLTPSAMGVAAV